MSVAIGLYLLERQDTPAPDEWARCVVAAGSEKEARQVANQGCRSEGYVWTDGHLVLSKFLGAAAEDVSGVVIYSRDKD
jgi:hypothetical protein